MVRSFSIQNGLPSRATRKCAITGVRPDKAATASADVAITGLAIASNAAPPARSAISVSHCRRRDDSQKSELSIGSRFIVDTARDAANSRS